MIFWKSYVFFFFFFFFSGLSRAGAGEPGVGCLAGWLPVCPISYFAYLYVQRVLTLLSTTMRHSVNLV